MVNIIVSESVIQNRIKLIFNFIFDTSNTASVEQWLNAAWYELWGMQNILVEATNTISCFKEKQELDRILESIAQALLDIERLYDKDVDEKQLNNF
jgi:hypothetical protein